MTPRVSFMVNGKPIFSIPSNPEIEDYYFWGYNCQALGFDATEAHRIIHENNHSSEQIDTFFDGFFNSNIETRSNVS